MLPKQLALVEDAIRAAIDALVRHDTEAALAVIVADGRINEAQRSVSTQIARTIATQQPVARDLPVFGRRIGDALALEPVRIVRDLVPGAQVGGHVERRQRGRPASRAGRAAIAEFLSRKWARELDYRLIKEVWAFAGNRIAVRFVYEWRDDSGAWYRSHGNEQWEFDAHGLMRRREASINDVTIVEAERKFRWPRSAA